MYCSPCEMITKRLPQSKCVTKPIFLDGLYFVENKCYFKDIKQNNNLLDQNLKIYGAFNPMGF